jgi:hypothetical protein
MEKAQITTKSMGTVDVQLAYGKYSSYLLPDSVTFMVDIKKFKIPRALAGEIETKKKPTNGDVPPSKQGKIYIRYNKYIINQGVSDDVFKK